MNIVWAFTFNLEIIINLGFHIVKAIHNKSLIQPVMHDKVFHETVSKIFPWGWHCQAFLIFKLRIIFQCANFIYMDLANAFSIFMSIDLNNYYIWIHYPFSEFQGRIDLLQLWGRNFPYIKGNNQHSQWDVRLHIFDVLVLIWSIETIKWVGNQVILKLIRAISQRSTLPESKHHIFPIY